MPSNDITVCVSTECPQRTRCLRHKSRRKSLDAYQSYADFYCEDDERECGYYMQDIYMNRRNDE